MTLKVLKKMGFVGVLSLVIFFPLISVVSAQTPDTGTTDQTSGITTYCVGNDGKDAPCNSFDELIGAVKTLVNFAVTFALSFSVVVLAVAGWTYMTSGGDPGKVKKAHEMFLSVAKGIFFVLAAWFIVNLIMTTLTSGIQNYIQ